MNYSFQAYCFLEIIRDLNNVMKIINENNKKKYQKTKLWFKI